MAPVLVAGQWRTSNSVGSFPAENPSLGEALPGLYPVSSPAEVEECIVAGVQAAEALRSASGAAIADFLEGYAQRIESRAAEFVELAHAESGLPKAPRLKDGELPRTTDQLR